jgi:nucleotide-binding universal stress UspA family protein
MTTHTRTPVFDRVVCGVDASEAGEAAARVAERITAPNGTLTLVDGDPLSTLLAEIARRDATAVVVGSDRSAAADPGPGPVSMLLLHEAPCSVLIARAPVDPARWPQRIVAGLDGSADSALAFEAASALAERLDAELRAVVATRDARVDVAAALRIAPGCEEHDTGALELFDQASQAADVLVVGSRGFRLRALGSLSERIAHEARCSVLVVRSSQP